MGRKVAEATNACRMRRTRGEIGRLRRFAAAAFGLAPVDFLAELAEGVLLAGFVVFWAVVASPDEAVATLTRALAHRST